VLDGVCVVRTSHFKKFPEMFFGRPGLVLEVALGSHYALLTRVTSSLVTIIVASYYGDTMGSLLLPLLASLSAFPSALGGGLGARRQLLGSFWLFAAKLMNQGTTCHVVPERRDDVNIGCIRKLMALL
jgi:hypothetical protein